MRAFAVLAVSVLLMGLLVALPEGTDHAGLPTLAHRAAAQDPNNTTVPDDTDPFGAPFDQTVVIQASPERGFARVGENDLAVFPVRFTDASVQGTEFAAAGIPIRCDVVNQTAGASNWAFIPSAIPALKRHQSFTVDFNVATGPRPSPEFFATVLECRAGYPVDDVIGRFTLRAQAEEYVYMTMSPGPPLGTVGPDEQVEFQFTLSNSGSHPKRFNGRVEAPDGWMFPNPPAIVVEPGESKVVNITGWSPRDKMVYISEAQPVRIFYAPDGAEGKEQLVFYSVTMQGVYLHPAIVPFTLLALTLLGVFLWLAILTRRHIEEQILGKPVPPWRIPEEQAYLAELEKEDPDEFYTVRYYLMVEEHRSALLWYEAFKKATKKDRKKETKWVKLKNKQEAKAERVGGKLDKVDRKFDRKVKFARWREGRKVKKLQRKHDRFLAKGQKKIDKKHAKRVKKIEKRHAKTVAKAMKKHDKLVAKETKSVEKENKKRAKRDEGPLPMPELEAPTFDDPVLPEREVLEETGLDKGRYAPKLEKLNGRFDRKVDRIERRRAKKKDRKAEKVERKKGKILDKIPPEPETNLYQENRFVPEDEAVIEEDRSPLERILHVPTLEERERARRRRMVYLAKRQELKEAGDEEALAQLEAEYKAEKKGLSDEARADAVSEKEAKAIAKAEAKAKRKAVKERAKELAKEAEEEAAHAEAGPGPEPGAPKKKGGFLAKIKPAKGDGSTEEAPEATPDGAEAGGDGTEDAKRGILAKLRPGKKGAGEEPDSEDTKEATAASPSSGPEGSKDQE